ncbi:MAG: DUF378 domain-containing protein [Patescibacteria group bacterium]|jgi:hypothetical protein
MKMNALDWIVMILLIIGGLNWGLVGFFDWDLVAEIFDAGSVASRVVYAIVGVSALVFMIRMFMMKSEKPAVMPQQ